MYRWLKNGVPLGDYSSELFYKIHNTQRQDAGAYQCIAKNDVGAVYSEKNQIVVACEYPRTYPYHLFNIVPSRLNARPWINNSLEELYQEKGNVFPNYVKYFIDYAYQTIYGKDKDKALS